MGSQLVWSQKNSSFNNILKYLETVHLIRNNENLINFWSFDANTCRSFFYPFWSVACYPKKFIIKSNFSRVKRRIYLLHTQSKICLGCLLRFVIERSRLIRYMGQASYIRSPIITKSKPKYKTGQVRSSGRECTKRKKYRVGACVSLTDGWKLETHFTSEPSCVLFIKTTNRAS